MRQSRDDLRRNGLRFYSHGIARMPSDPNSCLETFGRERACLGQTMLKHEARMPAGDNGGFDGDLVAETRRQQKSRARFRHGMTQKIVSLEIFDLLHADRALDENRRRNIEDFEIARIKDDAGGVAVAHSMRVLRMLINMSGSAIRNQVLEIRNWMLWARLERQ